MAALPCDNTDKGKYWPPVAAVTTAMQAQIAGIHIWIPMNTNFHTNIYGWGCQVTRLSPSKHHNGGLHVLHDAGSSHGNVEYL